MPVMSRPRTAAGLLPFYACIRRWCGAGCADLSLLGQPSSLDRVGPDAYGSDIKTILTLEPN
jgi:hypothetical protein